MNVQPKRRYTDTDVVRHDVINETAVDRPANAIDVFEEEFLVHRCVSVL